MKHCAALLLALLTVNLGACSHEAAAPATTQAAAASAPAQTQPTPVANLAPDQSSGPAASASTPAVADNVATSSAAAVAPTDAQDPADGSDDAPVVGTTSLEKIADLPTQHQLPDGKWKAGISYDPIVPAQPTSVPASKVEVMEVFWFACPHCYALEPFLAAWRKTKPDYIEFVRVPVMWGPIHRDHAQLYYTLQQLGREDLDDKVFETLHQQQNPLAGNTAEATFQLQLQFAKENGINPDAFRKAYNSFAVNAALQRAAEITDRYHVDFVPLIVINGKYMTDVSKVGTHENLIAEINDLAASEHKR